MRSTPSDDPTSRSAVPDDHPGFDAIIERLGRDPGEYRLALEGLGRLEPAERAAIVAELERRGGNPSAATLLRLIASGGDELGNQSVAAHGFASCHVSPVDGEGRGMVAVSARRDGRRVTAVFLCDVRRGLQDVRGEIEPESEHAGGLMEAIRRDGSETPGVANDAELALALLAAGLELAGAAIPVNVGDWLAAAVGPDFRPAPLPARLVQTAPEGEPETAQRALEVLDACPSWFDDSPLTRELAGELLFRHGARPPDPDRDAGAYRFLFERRLIDRLDLYRSMLLWMALLWDRSGEQRLAESAVLLAGQLMDEQFAVPSHPLVIALATRSLERAQAALIAAGMARIRPDAS